MGVQKGKAWLRFPEDFPQNWTDSHFVQRDGRQVQKGYFEAIPDWSPAMPYYYGHRFIDPSGRLWSYRGLPRSLPNRSPR